MNKRTQFEFLRNYTAPQYAQGVFAGTFLRNAYKNERNMLFDIFYVIIRNLVQLC